MTNHKDNIYPMTRFCQARLRNLHETYHADSILPIFHAMIRQIALVTIFAAVLLIGAAYASAFVPGSSPLWGAWLMVLGISTLMVAVMVLGAVRKGRVGRLWIPFGLVFLILVGGFGAALLMPAESAAEVVLWLGLPPRAAVILYGIGLLPLFLVPLAYAFTFEDQTLSTGDLEQVLAVARERTRRLAADLVDADAGQTASPVGAATQPLAAAGDATGAAGNRPRTEQR